MIPAIARNSKKIPSSWVEPWPITSESMRTLDRRAQPGREAGACRHEEPGATLSYAQRTAQDSHGSGLAPVHGAGPGSVGRPGPTGGGGTGPAHDRGELDGP